MDSVPEAEILGMSFAKNPFPMWVFDRQTLFFLDVNDAAVQQYGYSRQEFLTMTVLAIRPKEDVAEFLRQTPKPRPQGKSTAQMWRHRAKDNSVFTVSITSWELEFRGRPAELVLARRTG
jgi:PAS domain S-box-containing protein